MLIKSHLFSRGHPLKAEPRLTDVLDNHKRQAIGRINSVSNLDQMTDAFVERLVKDSLVTPISFQFERMTKKLREELVDGSALPFNRLGDRGQQYSTQVARISIPFTGDPPLLDYAPKVCGLTFPLGEVSSGKIQFDVTLWADAPERAKDDIRKNLELLESCATGVNKQVKEFNDSLSTQAKSAFSTKLDELTKQIAILDDLGIPDEPEPISTTTRPQPKRGKARAGQIIINVDTMFIHTLNQFNYNVGDVNNAIQSN